jgi:tape measure domain-containing protein
MAAKTITAFKVRTELIADARQQTAEYKKQEGVVTHYTDHLKKAGKEASKAFDGAGAGARFGKDFGASAVSSIAGSFSIATLGGLIGTAIAPGIGTAIGSAIGGGVDSALSKVTPLILEQISGGIALNKMLEETAYEFKTFVGNEQEANKYLKELLVISKDVGILPAVLIDASEKLIDLTGNLKITRTILKASADQAADFGGSLEVFQKVAETLGIIVEKGELGSRELQKLFRLAVPAKKILAEATGLQEKQIDQLIASGRIRGEVAARLIAEGIQRDKGGFAAARTGATVAGRERQFNVLTQLRSAEATQEATRGIGDFYQKANAILDSPQAQAFVSFVNNYTGKLIDFTEKALKVGVSVGGGVAEGIMNFSPSTMMQSFTKLGGFVETGLKSVFEIKSPSERSAREIGEPLGEGIGVGMVRRFQGFMQDEGRDAVVATLEALLQDPKIQALLKTIEWAEGGAPNRIVGGRTVRDLSRHPNIVGLRTAQGPSTAAGSFQITGTNWYGKRGQPGLQQRLGLPDFSLHSQQLAALAIIAGHPGGLDALKSGNITKLMGITAKDWTSTPGSRIGGGGQRSAESWMGHFESFLGGSAISDSNPMPVKISSGQGQYLDRLLAQGNRGLSDLRSGGDQAEFNSLFQQPQERIITLGEEDAARVTRFFSKTSDDLIESTRATGAEFVAMSQLVPRPVIPLVQAEKYHADTSIALTKAYQEAARAELIKGLSLVDQISGALGQIAGMMPGGGGEVGKKKGFFSKLLGFAAPFLSFIPGVGPIASQLAGMASNALVGNWGGVVSGLAGGLQPGGVFRSAARPPSLPGKAGRAMGGPGTRGQVYWTGERGPEPFLAPENGRFLSHRDAMGAMSGRSSPAMEAMLERIARSLDRFESMPAHEVVRTGARGFLKAQDNDAGLTEAMGRRLRLA